MKNLKRVLSLGLASVMLLGMMVVGASAKDFTDAEDIINKEAVQVMVALGVINGKEDGSYYAPKDNVSRAEMAKMITVILMGGNDVKTGVKGNPTFTDIANNWAEDYIEYCADTGIISGRGDGTFDPNGEVTVLEATKMALTAMGYNQDAYRLTGAAWAGMTAETARTMTGVKLFDGLEASNAILHAPATRDVAAQILWNALQGWVVLYQPDRNTNSGEVSWKYVVQDGTSLLNQRYDATVSTGIFEGNHNYAPNTVSPEKGEIYVSGVPGNVTGGATFPSDFSIDNIGEEVKVVWKDNKVKGTKNKLEKDDTVFGVFVTGGTRVIRSQLSKVKDYKVKDKGLNIDGNVYPAESSVNIVTNFGKNLTSSGNGASKSFTTEGVSPSTDAQGIADTGSNSHLTSALKRNSGNKFKAVFDVDSGKISTIYLVEDYAATVTAVNSTGVTLNNFGTLKFEDHDIEEGLKKGDVVSVTPLYGTATGAATTTTGATITVKKAEVVSGELEGFKSSDENKGDESLTIDDKTYKINYKNPKAFAAVSDHSAFGLLDNIPDVDGTVVTKFEGTENDYIGEDFDLYLVNGYVVAAVQTSKGANNYSVITEVKGNSATGSAFNRLQLQVMNAEGEMDIITVSSDSVQSSQIIRNDAGSVITVRDPSKKDGKLAKKEAFTNADYTVGDIITYTFDENDEAEVKVIGQAKAGSLVYNDSAKTVNTKATSADCVLFVQTETGISITPNTSFDKITGEPNWEAYDIRSLDKLEAAGVDAYTMAYNKDGKVVAVFVNLGNEPEGASSDRVYAMIKSYDGRWKDYYKYTVVSNGESWQIMSKNYKSEDFTERDLVTFKRTANDTYAAGKVVKLGAGNTSPIADKDKKDNGVADTFAVYVDNYSSRDNTLTFFDDVAKKSGDVIWEGVKPAKTYALDKDCVVLYVDLEAKTSDGGAINSFDPTSSRANALMIVDGKENDLNDPIVIKVLVINSAITRKLPGTTDK